jgi:hypothetical protein
MGEIITYSPQPNELGYAFGGRGPVAQLRSGGVLVVDTVDCFGGAVSTVDDLPSKVCHMPYLNPVSGPSGGAESGSAMPATAFSLLSGLCGGGCGVRQVSCTGLWCRA